MAFYQFKADYFANAGALTTKVDAFFLNVTAGHLIFVVVGWETGTGITITSTGSAVGNTYTALPLIAGAAHSCQAFYCLSTIAGTESFTASFSGVGATYIQMMLAEYPTISATLTAHAEQTGAHSPISSPSVTATGSRNIVIGYADGIAGTTTTTAPFFQESANTGLRSALADKDVIAGSYAAAFACTSDPTTWECGVASFVLAPVAGAPQQIFC